MQVMMAAVAFSSFSSSSAFLSFSSLVVVVSSFSSSLTVGSDVPVPLLTADDGPQSEHAEVAYQSDGGGWTRRRRTW
jgi:hypothetical protein